MFEVKGKKKMSFRLAWTMAVMAIFLSSFGQYVYAAPENEKIVVEETVVEETVVEETVVEEIVSTEEVEKAAVDGITYEETPEDYSDGVLMWGGLLSNREKLSQIEFQNKYTAQELKDAIYAGIRNRQSQVDLSAYNIHWDDVTTVLFPCVKEVLNEHPDLFFVGGYSANGIYATDHFIVSSLTLTYSDKYSEADVQAFYQVAAQIIAQITPDMNAEQKLLYLHDYIITHCQYDVSVFDDPDNAKYNAYNALVEHSAVCQGYSEAYQFLCNEAGIECYVVSSHEINHAWNLVKLDGAYYFVDCTWDDPLYSENTFFYDAHCGHENFLRSREGIVLTGHNNLDDDADWTIETADWVATTLGPACGYATEVESAKYDEYYWSDVITAIPYVNGINAYAVRDDLSNVYLRNANGDVTKVSLGNNSLKWYVWESYYYYTKTYASVTKVGDNFYFSTKDKIYKLTPSGTTEMIYELTAEEKAIGYVYGIVGEGKTINYWLGTQPNQETANTKKTIDVSDPAFIRTALAEFTGQIGVAFLVEIPDWLAQDEGAYAEFTKNGKKATQLVSAALEEELGEYTVRRFRQLVVAKEYGDVINFRLYDGKGDPVQLVGYNGDYTATGANLSLEQYVNYIKANAGNYEEKDVELVTALEDYCNVARIHFGYNSAGLTPSAAVQAIQNSDFNNYAQVVTGTKPAEVSKGDITVSFESDNSLKLYFTYSSTEVNPNSLSYAIDGKGATLCQDSKGYFIALRNIPAKYLDQPHYFSVSNGTETLTIYMSAMTYARIIVTSGSDYTEDEKNLGRALLIYNRAARSYFNVTDTY